MGKILPPPSFSFLRCPCLSCHTKLPIRCSIVLRRRNNSTVCDVGSLLFSPTHQSLSLSLSSSSSIKLERGGRERILILPLIFWCGRKEKMITRHNLADQLREYQIRSKHDWASASFFSSTSHNNFTSRMDIVIFVIWELIILAFLVSSAVSLYFRHMQLAFVLICVTLLMLLCMKITKQIRQARKKKRRMLLPLSM